MAPILNCLIRRFIQVRRNCPLKPRLLENSSLQVCTIQGFVIFMLWYFAKNSEFNFSNCHNVEVVSRPELFNKKMSLKASQNSLEETCARVHFLVVVGDRKPKILLKKGPHHKHFSCEFYEKFQNICFGEHLWKAFPEMQHNRRLKKTQ